MKSKRNMTQREMIRHDLEAGKTITPLYALENYGCYRLSARICELREMGMDIITKQHSNDNMYAHYSLAKEA